jgi:hypothetical protein
MKLLTVLLTVTLFLSACQKATDKDANQPGEYYYKVTINGINYQQCPGSDNHYISSSYIRGSSSGE